MIVSTLITGLKDRFTRGPSVAPDVDLGFFVLNGIALL
jgi:hypothetical protein